MKTLPASPVICNTHSLPMAERLAPTRTCVDLPNAVVLDGVPIADGEGVIAGLALALTDEEGARLVADLQQLLLRIGTLDATKEPPTTDGRTDKNKDGLTKTKPVLSMDAQTTYQLQTERTN